MNKVTSKRLISWGPND